LLTEVVIFTPDDSNTRGIEWLMGRPQAAIWFGVGVGKTVTALTAFEGLRVLGEVETALVVAPIRVSTMSWPDEIKKWAHTKHLRVKNLRDVDLAAVKRTDAEIFTTNYEQLPKLAEQLFDRSGAFPFDLLVFDESTMVKNPKGTRIKSLMPHLSRFSHRWGLTGEAYPNDLQEIFMQVKVLDDGKRLGKSFYQFRERYFKATDYMKFNWVLKGEAEKNEILAKVSDLALTITREEANVIGEPEEVDITVELPLLVQEEYDELEKDFLLQLDEGKVTVSAASSGVLVNKLRQYAGGSVYDELGKARLTHWEKVKALKKLIAGLPGNALVACEYRHFIAAIRQEIPEVRYIDPDQTKAEQQALLRQWNTGEVKVLLAHPASIGHGLNLQSGGNTVIWFSPPWSRELYLQMNGRLSRRGQTKTVTIYRIIAKDTIDQDVIKVLSRRETDTREYNRLLKELQARNRPPGT
jgi:SNF2 family DNA or RNA helicase